MLISKELNAAINEQIGHELQASHQYSVIAAYFESLALKKWPRCSSSRATKSTNTL